MMEPWTPPRQKHRNRQNHFRLTNARIGVIEVLANFGVATRNQIARLLFNVAKPTDSQKRQARQLTTDLEVSGYIRHVAWLTRAYGLTAKGVAEAISREMSDPYELSPDKSLETVEHELKRTETHAVIEQLSEKHGWELHWQKTDLYRTVEPDDLFAITKGGETQYFFFEEENHKKTHEDLYRKAKRYFDYYDTDRCFKEWGYFRKFNVLFQFENEGRMKNFMQFMNGTCRCTYYRGAIHHTCLPHALKQPPITTKNFLFTHDGLIYHESGEPFVFTAADHAKRSYSLREL